MLHAQLLGLLATVTVRDHPFHFSVNLQTFSSLRVPVYRDNLSHEFEVHLEVALHLLN